MYGRSAFKGVEIKDVLAPAGAHKPFGFFRVNIDTGGDDQIIVIDHPFVFGQFDTVGSGFDQFDI